MDTTQTGNGVMFDVTSYPACGSVGPESGLSSLVCVAEKWGLLKRNLR